MTIETEALMDRLRLKKSLRKWQYGALALLAILAISLFGGKGGDKFKSDHIARITVNGLILDSRKKQKQLLKLAKSDAVKAVIVSINSPGGSTSGGEMLYNGLREIAKKKPVVAVFGTLAASAGYMTGIAADHIVARSNTITGSVGVIFQWADVSDLLGKVGVTFHEVKSGVLKATPSPYQKPDEGGLLVVKDMVEDSFKWFRELVEKRRKLKLEDVKGLKDGRIFSGRQALANKLIDEIGDEQTAIDWLVKKRKISKDLLVVTHSVKKTDALSFLSSLSSVLEKITGLSLQGTSALYPAQVIHDRLQLNGLVSLWNPVMQ